MSCRTKRFPGTNRLTKPSEFNEVFNTPFRSVDGNLMILAKRNNLGRARLGLAISKKSICSAVNRNKVKRLIRESFRQRKQQMKGLDIVVLAQKKIDLNNNENIYKSLSKHWEKLQKCAK